MAEQKSHINSAYAWYVVVILLLAQALSYVDRQILSLAQFLAGVDDLVAG